MEDAVGSAQGWEQADIDRLWRSLHRDIRRRGVDVHMADDVAQETWLRIAARPPKMDRALAPWLWVVGARVLAELRRKDLSRSARERRAARPGTTPGAAPASDDSRVVRLVASLPGPYREVVTLRYVEDLEIEEIARRLERTPVTVRSQLKRGLARLRVRLEENEAYGGRARRSAWSLLPWLRLFRRAGARRALVGLGAGVALVAAVFLATRRAEPRAGTVVAALADRPRQSSTSETIPRTPAGERTALGEVSEDDQPSSTTVPPRTSTGNVRFPDGMPAAGATVWKGSGGGKGARVVALTDAAGRYAAESVEFNRFLWATLPGWLPSRRTHVGSAVAEKPFELVLGTSRGRLTLRVKGEDSEPVARAEVELDWGFDRPATQLLTGSGELQYESEAQSGWTDDLGELELARPHATRARLRLRAEGRLDHVESVDLPEGDASLVITLPRAAPPLGVAAEGAGTAEPGPTTLHGRVLAGGRPLPNALVLCSASPDGGAPETSRSTTDSAGRFALPGRRPGEVVALRVHGPAWDLLCERASVVVGQDEVVLSSSLDPSARRLVLEFESADPALVPTLVEIRSRVLPEKARVFPVDVATRTCTLAVPRTSAFEVFPWVPELGSWRVESAEIASAERARLTVPRPGLVTFALDLPLDVPPAAVHGGLRVPGLSAMFVASTVGLLSIRELELDPLTLSARVRVFPGAQRYFFRGPGLAQAAGVVRVAQAEDVTERIRMAPGVAARVIVRFPGRAVTPVLAARTSGGRVVLEGVPVVVAGSEAVFEVVLPVHTLALEARANGVSATKTLLPGELVNGTPVAEFSLELPATKGNPGATTPDSE